MGKEVLAHDVYTKDELRPYCACEVFFGKTARTQSWECCDHMFGYISRSRCVENIQVNIELSCDCTKVI